VIGTPARDSRLPMIALGYLALALIVTWPLAMGMSRDVPGDLGDSLLNMWILGWGAGHVPGLLTGATSWQGFWNANIFHPEPYSLALSEHMFAQALQVAPVYWFTGNIILCYNLIFISTFVISAIGSYLLVRDLTGDWRAGVIAGLVFGFLPYRTSQIPHVQVISSQWMPLALWGLHRYITRRSARGLAGGTAALVLQNWSCGYYVLYFAPFVPIFAVHQMWVARRLRDPRAWLGLVMAGAVTVALTLPFLLPYLEVQKLHGLERPLGEVLAFSANVWSYATAAEGIHLWGRLLRLHPHGEGETFLGITAVVLAGVALAGAIADSRRGVAMRPRGPGWRRALAITLALVTAVQSFAFLSTVLAGGFLVKVGSLTIRASTPVRLLSQALIACTAWLAVSPRARAIARGITLSPVTFYLTLFALAVWLSLGPAPSAGADRVSGMGLYSVLYEHVPGFTGVRVPARYAMVAGLFLSVLAGYGAARLGRHRWATPALALAGILIIADSAAMPLPMNHTWGMNEATPPARVFPAASAPRVYQRVAALPAGTAIAEFPFGDTAWEIRYVYYAAAHGKAILNGYSGAFPPAYLRRVAALQRVATDGDAAWQALVEAGTTHLVVHVPAFANPDEPRLLIGWLERHGAQLIESFSEGDALYSMP
jgi:hypothetical protein